VAKLWEQGVIGSNPVFPTIYLSWKAVGYPSSGAGRFLFAGGLPSVL